MKKRKPLKVQGVCSYCKGVGMVPDFNSPVTANKVNGKTCPECKGLTVDKNLTMLHT